MGSIFCPFAKRKNNLLAIKIYYYILWVTGIHLAYVRLRNANESAGLAVTVLNI